jgi:hypothetical protein
MTGKKATSHFLMLYFKNPGVKFYRRPKTTDPVKIFVCLLAAV